MLIIVGLRLPLAGDPVVCLGSMFHKSKSVKSLCDSFNRHLIALG